MKQIRNLLTTILCTGAMLLQPAALTARAVPRPPDWNPSMEWTIDDSGTLTVSCPGRMSDLPFEAVDAPWKDVRSTIRKIVVADGVTNIKAYAFEECTNVTEIVIPDSVTVIGSYAFKDCTALRSAVLPDSATDLGSGLFCGCTSLTEIMYPAGITQIPSGLLEGCSSMEDLLIPDTVTEIGTGAFSHCVKVDEVELPPHLTKIGGDAFSFCTGLKKIRIPEGVTVIEYDAFRDCSHLSEIYIPQTAHEISALAFRGTPWFKSKIAEDPVLILNNMVVNARKASGDIVLDRDVKTIGYDAFYQAADLTSVTILNPACELQDIETNPDFTMFEKNVKLRGYSGSTAEQFAKQKSLTFESISGTAEGAIPGDVNEDGSVDILDVILLNKAVLGSVTLTETQQAAADVDGNGTVDSNDSLQVLKMTLAAD